MSHPNKIFDVKALTSSNPPAKAKPPKPRALPPIIGTIKITVACGHEIDFILFEDKKDMYRPQRRAKAEKRMCADCRKAMEIEAAKNRKIKRANRVPGWQKAACRLPHGAHFDVKYNAELCVWEGSLKVPVAGKDEEFLGDASAVFRLLAALDKQFRAWIAKQPLDLQELLRKSQPGVEESSTPQIPDKPPE